MNYEYEVALPFTGYVYVTVTSEEPLSEEEVFNLAVEEADFPADIAEMDYHQHVTKGNVTYAVLNEIDITERRLNEEQE